MSKKQLKEKLVKELIDARLKYDETVEKIKALQDNKPETYTYKGHQWRVGYNDERGVPYGRSEFIFNKITRTESVLLD